jgi:hypothetical protein
MSAELVGALKRKEATAEGDHAQEVAEWALPPEEMLLRQEALNMLQQGI